MNEYISQNGPKVLYLVLYSYHTYLHRPRPQNILCQQYENWSCEKEWLKGFLLEALKKTPFCAVYLLRFLLWFGRNLLFMHFLWKYIEAFFYIVK